jgi:hypothetical protein
VVALATLPVGLALVASGLGAYPYGGTRVLAYAAPAFVLLAAEGAMAGFAWLRVRGRPAAVGLAAVLLTPAALTAYRVAVPWERIDSSGASAYVLAHRRPADDVTGNFWEHLYYFRHLGRWFTPLTATFQPEHARLWLVLSGLTPAQQQHVVRHLSPGDWRTLEQREFTRTTVVLVQRPTQ